MKTVLWVCNTPLPEIQKAVGIRNYKEGWLTGISNQLRKRKDIFFHYIFPQNKSKEILRRTINGITFWGLYARHKKIYEINRDNIQVLKFIIAEINPDIVHIFGTEFPHSLECIYSVKDKKKIIVSLQGIVSELAKVYAMGIPIKDKMIGNFDEGKYRCILTEKYEFYKRGINEKKALANVENVIGRTQWDRRCVEEINSRCRYYHCNETLRDVFYEDDKWNIAEIQRYSIFVSQADYTIKGLHILISALPLIKIRYPDVKVYIAGDKGFLEKNTPYGCYIKKLLKSCQVEKNIIFSGYLTGEKIKQRLLQSHIMVMPSLLENSPNAIGEAMMLGVPVVASDVGGIPSIMNSGKEGYLYPCRDINKLAQMVCRIFANDRLAIHFSENGKKHAGILYNQSYNIEQLLSIYAQVTGKI